MADDYETVARRLGIPMFRVPDLRKLGGAPAPAAPAAPEAPRPSYEGVTLADVVMPKAAPAAPIGPPAPPRPSYEGASIAAPMTPGFSLPNAPKSASGAPAYKLAMADNVSSAPQMSPKVAKQVERVAANSDRATAAVKESLDADQRKKNLEGATFADDEDAAPAARPAAGGGGGGAAAMVVDPGGRRTASWQVQEGIQPSDEERDAVRTANESGRIANDLEYQAGQKAAEFQRGYQQRLADAAERDLVERRDRQAKYDAEVSSKMQELDGIRQQAREFKFDPNGGLNPGIARLGQAIAIGLGAFASKGGENAGLEAVKARAAQNLREQEMQLEKLHRDGSDVQNYLGQLRQKFGDKEAASQAFYTAQLETAKAELAKQLGDPSVADPRLLAAYTKMNKQLDEELVQHGLAFKQATQDRVVRSDVNAPPKVVGLGAGEPSKEAKADSRYLAENYEKAGIPGMLSSLKDVDRTIDAFGDGDIPGLGVLASKVPDILVGARGRAARQTVQTIKNAIGHAIFGGALSPTEAEKLNAQLEGAGDANSLRRTVQAVRQTLQMRAANIAAGASPEGVQLYEQRGGSVQRGHVSQRQVALDKGATPHQREPE